MKEPNTEKTEVATQMTENLEAIYWGYLKSRDVLDTNGEYIGVIRGILIAEDWTIPKVVIEVNLDELDELGVEAPLIGDALVELPSKYVRNKGDVLQLTEDAASLKGVAKPYFSTKTQVKTKAQDAEKKAAAKAKAARERAIADAHQMSEKVKKTAKVTRDKAKAKAHQTSEKVKMTAQEAKEKVKTRMKEAKRNR